jgi:excisionase family DNA binding protein
VGTDTVRRSAVQKAIRYLTSVEVAAACGVSPRTVTNWIRDGVIKAHRTVGGHGRVAVEELRRFLSTRGIPVPPELASDPVEDGEADDGRKRVLCIDDDEAFLEVVRELLTAHGYAVETARQSFLAGYLVGRRTPDVIVLDLVMPGLDGYEVLALLREREESKGIPVVACTSLRGADVEARLKNAGFDAFVKKPIDFKVLLRTVESLAGAAPAATG